MARARHALTFLTLLAAVALGCDDAEKPKNPFDPPPDQAKKPPPVTEPVKPKGPPELAIDTLSPKVGFSRVVMKEAADREKLAKEIAESKQHWDGEVVAISVDRKAPLDWVVAMFQELTKAGAKGFEVATETRAEFPQKLEFTPQSQASTSPACSVVAVVLSDRGTAVWKLSGGTASKRAKGFAGPDLTMTGDTIERYAKNCKQSDTLFVSANEGIEWGLVYDLAASTKKLEDVKLPKVVLLEERPTAGRAVSLD